MGSHLISKCIHCKCEKGKVKRDTDAELKDQQGGALFVATSPDMKQKKAKTGKKLPALNFPRHPISSSGTFLPAPSVPSGNEQGTSKMKSRITEEMSAEDWALLIAELELMGQDYPVEEWEMDENGEISWYSTTPTNDAFNYSFNSDEFPPLPTQVRLLKSGASGAKRGRAFTYATTPQPATTIKATTSLAAAHHGGHNYSKGGNSGISYLKPIVTEHAASGGAALLSPGAGYNPVVQGDKKKREDCCWPASSKSIQPSTIPPTPTTTRLRPVRNRGALSRTYAKNQSTRKKWKKMKSRFKKELQRQATNESTRKLAADESMCPYFDNMIFLLSYLEDTPIGVSSNPTAEQQPMAVATAREKAFPGSDECNRLASGASRVGVELFNFTRPGGDRDADGSDSDSSED